MFELSELFILCRGKKWFIPYIDPHKIIIEKLGKGDAYLIKSSSLYERTTKSRFSCEYL